MAIIWIYPYERTFVYKNMIIAKMGHILSRYVRTSEKNIFGYICRDNPCGCPSLVLNQLGQIAEAQICYIENRYQIKFKNHVIMPNHIHAIIEIDFPSGDGQPQGLSLQKIVGGYKSRISSEWLKICNKENMIMGEIWQSRYHDHIIRDQDSYNTIWQYIDSNVATWETDCFYQPE